MNRIFLDRFADRFGEDFGSELLDNHVATMVVLRHFLFISYPL